MPGKGIKKIHINEVLKKLFKNVHCIKYASLINLYYIKIKDKSSNNKDSKNKVKTKEQAQHYMFELNVQCWLLPQQQVTVTVTSVDFLQNPKLESPSFSMNCNIPPTVANA